MFDHVVIRNDPKSPKSDLHGLVRVLCGMTLAGVFLGICLSLWQSPKAEPTLAALVTQHIDDSGVINPVTAVLLNFRAYDTLLEIVVLLIAALAIRPLPSITPPLPWLRRRIDSEKDPILIGLVGWLVPLGIIIGTFLLWIGAFAPGGAFQAGAVIAGAGVAIVLARQHQFSWTAWHARVLVAIGLVVFIGVAAGLIGITGTVLDYPLAFAGTLILFIETAATCSIALILLLLFCSLAEGWENSTAATEPPKTIGNGGQA